MDERLKEGLAESVAALICAGIMVIVIVAHYIMSPYT